MNKVYFLLLCLVFIFIYNIRTIKGESIEEFYINGYGDYIYGSYIDALECDNKLYLLSSKDLTITVYSDEDTKKLRVDIDEENLIYYKMFIDDENNIGIICSSYDSFVDTYTIYLVTLNGHYVYYDELFKTRLIDEFKIKFEKDDYIISYKDRKNYYFKVFDYSGNKICEKECLLTLFKEYHDATYYNGEVYISFTTNNLHYILKETKPEKTDFMVSLFHHVDDKLFYYIFDYTLSYEVSSNDYSRVENTYKYDVDRFINSYSDIRYISRMDTSYYLVDLNSGRITYLCEDNYLVTNNLCIVYKNGYNYLKKAYYSIEDKDDVYVNGVRVDVIEDFNESNNFEYVDLLRSISYNGLDLNIYSEKLLPLETNLISRKYAVGYTLLTNSLIEINGTIYNKEYTFNKSGTYNVKLLSMDKRESQNIEIEIYDRKFVSNKEVGVNKDIDYSVSANESEPVTLHNLGTSIHMSDSYGLNKLWLMIFPIFTLIGFSFLIFKRN